MSANWGDSDIQTLLTAEKINDNITGTVNDCVESTDSGKICYLHP